MDPTKRPAVVIDNGTGYTKVRRLGEERRRELKIYKETDQNIKKKTLLGSFACNNAPPSSWGFGFDFWEGRRGGRG